MQVLLSFFSWHPSHQYFQQLHCSKSGFDYSVGRMLIEEEVVYGSFRKREPFAP